MDKHTATEQAFKNGYAKGYEAGKPKWISVKERFPDVVQSYVVVVKCKYDWEKEYEIGVDIATYDPYTGNPCIDGCWHTYNDWNEGQEYLHVTHWMPLSMPPEGE